MSIVSPGEMTISPNLTGWSGLQGKIGAGEWRRFGFSFGCEIGGSFRRVKSGLCLQAPRNYIGIVHEVRSPAGLATAFLIAVFSAVCLHRQGRLLLLPFLDIGQNIAEPLVIDDRRMHHPLVLVECLRRGNSVRRHDVSRSSSLISLRARIDRRSTSSRLATFS